MTQRLLDGRWQDPAVLARIGNLELIARNVVDGFVSGLHRAVRLGQSIDFAEHRAYMPGDDLRRIDWRVFARTDRLYVKEYEADTNTDLCILLDVSASMDFGETPSKLDYACMLASCLLYLGRQQRDRVGLLSFADSIIDYVPPAVRHYDIALHRLSGLRKGRAGSFTQPLRSAAERLRRRGVLVLLSDLYQEPEALASILGELRLRGHDLIVFHILDPSEIDFPYDQATVFEDSESGEQLAVNAALLAADYRAAMQAHIDTLRQGMGGQAVDYTLLRTDQALDWGLWRYLSQRAAQQRVR